MSQDYINGYSNLETKYRAAQTYVQSKNDRNRLEKEQRDNLEKDYNLTTTTLDNLKSTQNRYQRQTKTQLDHLLSATQFGSGSGSVIVSYIKRKFAETAIKIEPQILGLLEAEAIKALGCSQEQTYTPQSIFIPVQSVDLFRMLQTSPDVNWARIAYEKAPPFFGQRPYSMNRQLWELIQNINVPIDYYGASGQKLFSISYVNTNGIITGDFFKVDLVNKSVGLNGVASFMIDYYKSIKVVDIMNIFQQLMDLISGAISLDAKLGYGELENKNKLAILLQRILGLCFDSVREIDVSGVSKIPELDIIDNSFFEFTDIDLRNINEQIWNTQNGVVEFEDCQNVKLPVNVKNVIDSLNSMYEITRVDDLINSAVNLTNALTDDERWKILFPDTLFLNLKVDFSFILNLPKAIMMALLSPKVILPLLIMSKAIGSLGNFAINTFTEFFVIFKKFSINIMSKIGAIFVEELFQIIAKDIRGLVASIAADLAREKSLKKYAIILKLVEIIIIVAKLINDWRKCKSVIDELLALFNSIRTPLGYAIPAPLLAASQLLDGYSATRAYINVIEELQKIGVHTGPMQDGSPNLFVQSIFSQLIGQDREQAANGKVQVFIPSLPVTPYGTLPTGNVFGKSY